VAIGNGCGRTQKMNVRRWIIRKYADQSVSFTDCVSFALLERHNIKCAISFDRHFAIAGFAVEP